MSTSQDLTFTMSTLRFAAFSAAISAFNRRTDELNKRAKKKKYQKVARWPTGSDVVKNTVTVRVAIKDRSKVLFQELTGIVDRYSLRQIERAAKAELPTITPLPPIKNPVLSPAKAKRKLKTTAENGKRVVEDSERKLNIVRILDDGEFPKAAVSKPVWGVWIPCFGKDAAQDLATAINTLRISDMFTDDEATVESK